MGNAPIPPKTPKKGPVHPHRRGERTYSRAPKSGLTGSSPQAWGTLYACVRVLAESRFIPTGVGNAHSRLWKGRCSTVHPHRRGERISSAPARGVTGGSSPQAWETRHLILPYEKHLRFIPTGVGNAIFSLLLSLRYPVHPHRRGERPSFSGSTSPQNGSSPQAWGTRGYFSGEYSGRRFIPTGVGNARRSYGSPPRRTVHPHRRGERIVKIVLILYPPRFIPTGVGNAGTSSQFSVGASVHPHRRGERVGQVRHGDGIIGSSPQAWGTRLVGGQDPLPQPVHPHRRGERAECEGGRCNLHGSSPQAWGTPGIGSGNNE